MKRDDYKVKQSDLDKLKIYLKKIDELRTNKGKNRTSL